MRIVSLIGIAVAFVTSSAAQAAPKGTLHVAAAADLATAMKDVNTAFTHKTGTPVTLSIGSSGQLEQQLANGAPYDVFVAANVDWVDTAVNSGACDAGTKRLYARGRLVMWPSAKSNVAPPTSLEDLADARFKRIAIANPQHAPYGKAAQQALQKAGVWDRVKPKLVYGENVQQTKQFADTGNADVAITAMALVSADPSAKAIAVDQSLYQPIDQAVVICAKNATGQQQAKEFVSFLTSPDGQRILQKYGFVFPGGSRATAR